MSQNKIAWGQSPYNFAPYAPNLIMPPIKHEKRKWSGQIRCRLTAQTPLLVAGKHHALPDQSTECEFLQINKQNYIQGSSIKGMLRSLVEILSYSGLRPMNKEKLFWRTVADTALYKTFFPAEPLGGFLRQYGADFVLTPVKVHKAIKPGKPAKEVKTGNKVPSRKSTDRSPNIYWFEEEANGPDVELDREIVQTLWRQLTPAQDSRKPWIAERKTWLKTRPGLPVFYRTDSTGKIVELGFCRYFRLEYRFSPYDLAWPNKDKRDIEDIAQSMFGYAGKDKSLAGRVAVESFAIKGQQAKPVNVVLGGPKPTCIPFYLQQKPESVTTYSSRGQLANHLSSMKNYNDKDAKLRGRKLYWHHQIMANDPPNANRKTVSVLRPLEAGASGEFVIHARELTDCELGCLFEALELAPSCMHKLGMAKPLGYGSVKIEILDTAIEDIEQKYASLAARFAAKPQFTKEMRQNLRQKFRQLIYGILKKVNRHDNAQDYYQLPQIAALHMILNWEKQPELSQMKYMSLQEFGLHGLLPQPQDVRKTQKHKGTKS